MSTNETRSLVGTIAAFDEFQVRCYCFVGGQQFHMWLPTGRYIAIREENITVSDLGCTRSCNAVAVRRDLPLGSYEVGAHQVYYIHAASLLANVPV